MKDLSPTDEDNEGIYHLGLESGFRLAKMYLNDLKNLIFDEILKE